MKPRAKNHLIKCKVAGKKEAAWHIYSRHETKATANEKMAALKANKKNHFLRFRYELATVGASA